MSDNSRITKVTDADFNERVLKAEGIVAVDFFEAWCPPCRQIKPYLPKLALDYEGRVTVMAYDRELGRVHYDKLGLKGIPNIVFFKKGVVVGQIVGGRPYKELRQAFAEALNGHAQARAIEPDAEALMEELAEGLDQQRMEEQAPLKEAFSKLSEPVLARIRPPYLEAVQKKQEGQLSQEDFAAARKQFEEAFRAELGEAYDKLEADLAEIDAEHDESMEYLIETLAEMAGDIYDLPETDPA